MGNEGSLPVKFGEPLENDTKVTWKGLNKNPKFSGREGHSACSIDTNLYIFGGITSSNGELNDTDELFIFDSGSLFNILVRLNVCLTAVCYDSDLFCLQFTYINDLFFKYFRSC